MVHLPPFSVFAGEGRLTPYYLIRAGHSLPDPLKVPYFPATTFLLPCINSENYKALHHPVKIGSISPVAIVQDDSAQFKQTSIPSIGDREHPLPVFHLVRGSECSNIPGDR
jgi:hypothetical protein